MAGNYRSGRPASNGSKPLAFDCAGLYVNALNRSGVLDTDGRDIPWKFYRPTETGRFFERWDYTRMREAGSITLRMMGSDLLCLSYTSGGRNYAYGVPIVTSPGTFGGERRWFLCPREVDDCGRRVAVLYLHDGMFLCRHCHGLGYWTQKASPANRAFHRADVIKVRLGVTQRG